MSNRFPQVATFSFAAVCFCVPVGPVRAADNAPPAQSIFHADPEHLWNRLHEALFVRLGPDGQAYGHDRLDPLLWSRTRHLLKADDRSRDQAVALLEEFINGKGEKMVEDPLKRAVLQRDLWLVFNWLDKNHGPFHDPELTEEIWQAAQQRLRGPLAAVIGRLALTPDQIKGLPDNYAAAVASGEFARRYDSEQPDKPYLPPDLFATDGPWVCVGRPDGPVTPQHLREDRGSQFTNSAFLVFLRLPAGRAATLDFLKQLRAFDQPLVVKPEQSAKGSKEFVPNPKLPQLPVGTETALARRALLINSSHAPVPSAITESVQIRVYREVPDVTAQTIEAALLEQSPYEFRMSRALLFAGRAGGLRAVGSERDFKTGFGSYAWDAFEIRDSNRRVFWQTMQQPNRQSCFDCHSLPGIKSFNTFHDFDRNRGRSPASLAEASLSQALESAVKWKEGRPAWTSLRKLLAE